MSLKLPLGAWRRRPLFAPARRQLGFSLIEVLIALVVLAVGLLGLALLQTTNLRYTQSAQQRTMAVNLASELLDTIRINRSQIHSYAMNEGSFADVTPAAAGCETFEVLSNANNVKRWQCEVREALGPDAYAEVNVVGAPSVVVKIVWGEANMAEVGTADGKVAGEIELSTTL